MLETQFFRDVRAFVRQHTPTIVRAVNFIDRSRRLWAPREENSDILMGRHCGKASLITAYLIHTQGYHVELVSVHPSWYGDVHQYLVVKSPGTSAELIVDPTFLQFKSRYWTPSRLNPPQEDHIGVALVGHEFALVETILRFRKIKIDDELARGRSLEALANDIEAFRVSEEVQREELRDLWRQDSKDPLRIRKPYQVTRAEAEILFCLQRGQDKR